MIRHYSFDLWLTLIKGSPTFKKERAKHIHTKYAKDNWKLSDVEGIIREVEKWGEAINLMNGRNVHALELYAMVIFRIQGHLNNISPLEMEILYKEVEEIFLKHHPVLYDENTKMVLDELKLRGKTMSLLSNTGFILGRTLDKLLEKLGIKDHFLFRIYSDEVGVSKPNKEIFKKMDMELPYDTKDILHVGDDVERDGIGAQEYGVPYMIINSNSFTIKDLL